MPEGATQQTSQSSGAPSQSGQGGTTATSATSSSQTSQGQTQATQQQTQGGQQQSGAGGQGGQQATTPERPAYVPEAHWDPQVGKVRDTFAQHVNDLTAFRAADEVRRNGLPQKAEDYQFVLPKDFQAPAGVEFKFNDADPNLQSARSLMHDIAQGKVTGQEAFSKLLGLYAGARVGETQSMQNARAAEVQKLGATGAARVTAVQTFLNGVLGEDAARSLAGSSDGKHPGVLWTADIVKSFETLITKLASGHGSSFSHANRETDAPKKLSDAEFAKLTYSEKKAYAAQFDQNQARPH